MALDEVPIVTIHTFVVHNTRWNFVVEFENILNDPHHSMTPYVRTNIHILDSVVNTSPASVTLSLECKASDRAARVATAGSHVDWISRVADLKGPGQIPVVLWRFREAETFRSESIRNGFE